MGTFAGYTGPGIINESKMKEFSRALSKILYYGGMMNTQEVKMYDKEIFLLAPVKIKKGEDVDFNYNYFEDDCWEYAGYMYGEGRFFSNKIGSAEFNDVVTTVYCLYELFDEGIGYAEVNGKIVNSYSYIGWINNLLKKNYCLEKRFRLWEYAEKVSMEKEKYGEVFDWAELMNLIPKNRWRYIGGTEFADLINIFFGTKVLLEDPIPSGSYPEDVLRCRNKIEDLLKKNGKDAGYNKIIDLLKMDADKRRAVKEELMISLAEDSLFLPARVLLYLAAELTNKDFWKEWLLNKDSFYHDEVLRQYASKTLMDIRKEGRKRPISSITTSEALKQGGGLIFYDTPVELKSRPNYYLTDADRLFWWDESDEVIIDEETDKWLKNIGKRVNDEEAKLPDEYNTQDFTKRFITLLFDIEDKYRRVFAFKSMFYEFVENIKKKHYRAAVELLSKMHEENMKSGEIIEKLNSWTYGNKNVKCNEGRMNMRRYLSLLANKKLRKKYLGF